MDNIPKLIISFLRGMEDADVIAPLSHSERKEYLSTIAALKEFKEASIIVSTITSRTGMLSEDPNFMKSLFDPRAALTAIAEGKMAPEISKAFQSFCINKGCFDNTLNDTKSAAALFVLATEIAVRIYVASRAAETVINDFKQTVESEINRKARLEAMHSPDPNGTTKELAEFLGISKSKVREARANGTLDALIKHKSI